MNPIVIAEVVAVLTQVIGLVPEVQAIIPVVQAALSGGTLTNDQLLALIEARQALEAKVKANAGSAA